ncbi:Acyltransferase [Seminavis robusta]|uniref:Acyltransferase n=1 Tax=Seminavis robusta TaxID=568900 RepID=A0A9N8EWP2_9STRA|nr:Acyltransferase [Seminavis robusta]|eukprot:Sro1922_g305590.1 Acyltransferase (419) ;mRNA; r:9627-10987
MRKSIPKISCQLVVLLASALLVPTSNAFSVPSSRRSSPVSVRSVISKSPLLPCQRSRGGLPLLSTVATTTIAEDAVPSESTPSSGSTLSNFTKNVTKFFMVAFIATVALGFISSLSIIRLLGVLRIGSETRRQKWALSTGQFVARWALRLIPFCKVDVITDKDAPSYKNPEPSIWVCNHMSMLDVFILLAKDLAMRGKNKRPIKVVYWKQLEDNPFTKILFRQSGFIPIDMVANKPGETNEYDRKSFKSFLKSSKQAFEDGFDVGVLPEGQLNPTPEKGLLPVFSGAYTLARMSKRPIQMMALHGVNQLWHPNDGFEVGDMNVTGRHIKMRLYPFGRKYESDEDFKATFSAVVGHFGKYGTDIEDLDQWLDGSKWKEIEMERKSLAAKKAQEQFHRGLLARRIADEKKESELNLQQQE